MSEETGQQANAAVAAEIRAEMARQRMTQTALADALKVSHAYVYRRLSGDTPAALTPLTLVDVSRIADALGVTVAALVRVADLARVTTADR